MIRIDFLGAAGTGKSTLYQALFASIRLGHGRHGTFLSAAQGRRCACANYMSQEPVNRRLRLYWHTRVHRSLVCYKIEEVGAKKAMCKFVENNQGFLATAHESFALSGRSEYRRAEGYYHFITTLRRLAFLEQWAGDVTVLFDESLSQKVYAVMPWDRDNEEHARRYFEHIPPPAGLVHIDADPELVVRRIREREKKTGKLIPGHRGLDDDALSEHTVASLRVAQAGTEILRQRGVPVASLHSQADVNENSNAVLHFVASINPNYDAADRGGE